MIGSLVPGSVAQQDGRLIPGDHLMSVNGVSLSPTPELDKAVKGLEHAYEVGVMRQQRGEKRKRPTE